MPDLTREAIVSAADGKREQVSVPEWGGDVYLRALDGETRDAMDEAYMSRRDKDGKVSNAVFRSIVLEYCLVDSAGARLFGDEQIAALNRKSASVLRRLYERAEKLNELGAEAVDAAEKNSASGRGAVSSSV